MDGRKNFLLDNLESLIRVHTNVKYFNRLAVTFKTKVLFKGSERLPNSVMYI